MIGQILVTNAILVLVYMTGVFLIARKRDRLDTVDTAWGIGFVLVAWATLLQEFSGHSVAIAFLVTIWGVRLARHIYSRSKKKGEDRRYQELADKWKGNKWLRAYFSIFLLQGVLLLIVSLPISLAAGIQLAGYEWLTIVGGVIWLFGFQVESAADLQLRNYLTQDNRPKVMDQGLWKYSRHPNYFGELVQWWGIGIIALQVEYGWIGLVGPLILTILICFVSGIPPIERRRKQDPDYRAYARRTSPLIPLPPRSETQ